MPERHYKRYRMEFDLKRTSITNLQLPEGFLWVPWDRSLLDAHARVKVECFQNEIDAELFPCLSQLAGARKLMNDITSRSNFLPATTWLIKNPCTIDGPKFCGTIQGMSRSLRLGAIQNVGITPDCRGLGLGKALVTRSLLGFAESGIQRVVLDVTAANRTAVNLYHQLGFRILDTSYLTRLVPEPAATV